MKEPTRLRLIGLVCDRDGQPLNLRSFGLPLRRQDKVGEVIAVVGASMDSGKTRLTGTLAQALVAAGYRVAAAKVTGTACGADSRFYASCGARPVLDFVDVGYPATYMLDPGQLLMLQSTLLTNLWASEPDFVVLEIADGIFQRETRMLLESWAANDTVDHVFFAATDSLGVESGVRHLRAYGLPLRATSGLVSRSQLGVREAEEATGVSCLSLPRLLKGDALRLIGLGDPPPAVAEADTAERNGHVGRVELVASVSSGGSF